MAKSVAKEKCEVYFLPAAENLSGTVAFRSLISNVAAKNLLSSDDVRNVSHSSNPSALILECSDISSILKTVERNSPSPIDIHQYQQEDNVNRVRKSTPFSEGSFDFHISNSNPVALARIVVLLVLARTSDKDWLEGLELFWAVWANPLLTKSQFQRFKAVAKSLAEGDSFPFKPSELRFPRSDDLRDLKSIWTAWAACKNLPSARLVMRERYTRIFSEFDEAENPEAKDYPKYKTWYRSKIFAEVIMALAFKPLFVEDEVQKAIGNELSSHYVSGTTYFVGHGALAHDVLDEVSSPELDFTYTPNPTLLDVDSWESCAQVSSTPFNSFSPIDSSALSCTRSVHQYCMDALNEQLRAFRFWSKLGKLTLSLYLGDPLELALHRLPRYLTGEVGGGGTRAGKKAGKFDVIDAGTLVDSVGVLNVLLCCGNLLHPIWIPTLFSAAPPPLTSPATPINPVSSHPTEWYKNAPSLKVFLQNDMPFLPLHILPSFTGMSLITDFAFDSQSPVATQHTLSLEEGTELSQERVLSWRRVTSWTDAAEGRSEPDASNQNETNQDGRDESWGSELSPERTPLTLVVSNDESRAGGVRRQRTGVAAPPPCGLWRVLQSAFWHCCRFLKSKNDDDHHKPLTWCLMVCHLSAQLDPDSLDTLRWQDLATSISLNLLNHDTRKSEFWMGLRAMIQYVLASLPSLHTPNLSRLFQCEEEGQEGVVRYCHTFQKDTRAKLLASPPHTQLGIALLLYTTVPAGSRFGNPMSLTLSSESAQTIMQLQVIDNVRLLNNRTQITLCLPKRHGLFRRVDVCLWTGRVKEAEFLCYFHDLVEIPLPTSNPSIPNPPTLPPSPNLRAQTKLAASKAGAALGARGRDGEVLQLLALCKFEEHYEATVKVPPQQEEKVEVRWSAGRTITWQVDIRMESHVTPLSFLSPVQCDSDFTTASRGSGTVLCTFEKSATWPLTPFEISTRMVDMNTLPNWCDGDDKLMYTLDYQFSLQQQLVMLRHAPLSLLDPKAYATASFQLRHTVKHIMMCHVFERAEDSVLTPCTVRIMSQEEARIVYISGKEGLKGDGQDDQ